MLLGSPFACLPSPAGTTTWVYESSDTTNPNKSDSSIFWTFLYLPFLLWSIFTFLLLIRLKFQWLPINLVSLSLSGANIYGYYKCSKEQKGKLDNLMRRGEKQSRSEATSWECDNYASYYEERSDEL
ncbi:hypothetical protein TL16_g06326 [Triparma laevis f. inornata]|uniref:Golgi apparatus membrane protein TVP23 homolog n=1 Tax=Triparma laevis f. inornata TaxID=1714386 RepID=A0A9W7AR15_9STRA|nr:hypothetical protein TL16_g06326 [Triparma laevis f. inornata]